MNGGLLEDMSNEDINMEKITYFMGTVATELRNGNKIMETLQIDLNTVKDSVAQLKQDFAVNNKETNMKRENCKGLFTSFFNDITEMKGRTARDSVVIKALQEKVNIDVGVENLEDTRIKKKRDKAVYVMGAILFATQILTFVFMFHKG